MASIPNLIPYLAGNPNTIFKNNQTCTRTLPLDSWWWLIKTLLETLACLVSLGAYRCVLKVFGHLKMQIGKASTIRHLFAPLGARIPWTPSSWEPCCTLGQPQGVLLVLLILMDKTATCTLFQVNWFTSLKYNMDFACSTCMTSIAMLSTSWFCVNSHWGTCSFRRLKTSAVSHSVIHSGDSFLLD